MKNIIIILCIFLLSSCERIKNDKEMRNICLDKASQFLKTHINRADDQLFQQTKDIWRTSTFKIYYGEKQSVVTCSYKEDMMVGEYIFDGSEIKIDGQLIK